MLRFQLSSRDKIRIKLFLNFVFIVLLLAALALVAKFIFTDYGWSLAIGISNLIFLVIIRLVDIEGIVGIDTIEKYWLDKKVISSTYLMRDSMAKKSSTHILLDSSIEKIFTPEIEGITKANFLIKDTKGSVTSFKNETVILIVLNILLIVVAIFGNIDYSSIIKIDPKLPKEAIDTINKIKSNIEIIILISSVCIQIAWLIRTPFLLDLRNKTYIVESIT